MSSTTRQEVLRHLTAVAELQPPVQKTGKAPYPTDMTHELYRAYTRAPHDVGGEHDVIDIDGVERGVDERLERC